MCEKDSFHFLYTLLHRHVARISDRRISPPETRGNSPDKVTTSPSPPIPMFSILLLIVPVTWTFPSPSRDANSCLFSVFSISPSFDGSACGSSKACLFVPTDCERHNACRRIFSYVDQGDGWMAMELFNDAQSEPDTNYVAVGFSDDEFMGEEPVTHCAFDPTTNEPHLHISRNTGKSNRAIKMNEKTLEPSNLELISASRANGRIFCAFKQRITPEDIGNQSTTDGPFLPQLSNEYFILLAHGKTANPKALAPHSLDPMSKEEFPFVSSRKLNLRDFHSKVTTNNDDQSTAEREKAPWLSPSTRRTMVLIHGMIMIFAWIFLVSTAVYSARYLRNHWPNSTPGSLRIWFHIHRSFNVTAVVLIAISALLIFIAKEFTWRGPTIYKTADENLTPGALHSLFGSIAILLAVIQPIGSLFRCSPDSRRRPIFNWLHRGAGLLAFLLALFTLCIAVFAFGVWWNRGWAIAAIVFFLVALIVVIIVGELLRATDQRLQTQQTISFEMKNHGPQHRRGDTITEIRRPKENPKPKWALTTLLFVSVLISVSVAVVLALLIAQS